MATPTVLAELVQRFERNRASYQAAQYNETQLRREFLDPLFKALGWDIDNERGHAEAYKDVIHEDAIKVGGATKAPDYCFRIGGRRIFFLEAKKPSVNLRDDVSAAFQLRRYAWSAKLPLSILSDFEELAVYDCRVKPDKLDKPSVGRVLFFTYDQYADRWDELADIFSREAVLKGSFDKFAESTKLKRGTAEVDTAFLQEIESWRELLAKNFAARNEIDQRDLNFAVQRTIDRLIFLRMCEDRGIEDYGQLMTLLNGEGAYRRLLEIYDRADERYNSGLFHFHAEKGRAEPPDELTTSLSLDDKPLKEIIRGLYYPDSPYEFSVLPAEILGQVYEQFLGKIIRQTPSGRAVVEDKPEVKKAGGVFYTPAYIVDYIVRETVGKLVAGQAPKQVSKLRVLDPACGSGSFLVGAFHFLLDWHRDWYVEDGAAKHAKEIYQGPGGQWLLTTAEKKRILLNNIYGVDIDSQAVEVTKLSLLLKVLERENRETLERQLRLLHERALPDLAGNIKCGNSLIGPDFYDQRQMTLLDEEEQYRINAFDWQAEFPEIFKGNERGFDAVIGNPPYVRMEEFKEIKDYLGAKYKVHVARADLYAYFVERAHGLLRPHGRFGMIISNKFIKANYGSPLRKFLADAATVEEIADFAGLKVFRGATVRTIALLTRRGLNREAAGSSTRYLAPVPPDVFSEIVAGVLPVSDVVATRGVTLAAGSLSPAEWHLVPDHHQRLIEKLRAGSVPLSDIVGGRVLWGVKTGLNEAFVITGERRKAILASNPEAEEIIKPFLFDEDVQRYFVEFQDRWLIYCFHGVEIGRFPAVEEHLRPFRRQLERRATKQKWYELQQPSVALVPVFAAPKIVYPEGSSDESVGVFGPVAGRRLRFLRDGQAIEWGVKVWKK